MLRESHTRKTIVAAGRKTFAFDCAAAKLIFAREYRSVEAFRSGGSRIRKQRAEEDRGHSVARGDAGGRCSMRGMRRTSSLCLFSALAAIAGERDAEAGMH
jgi:hypothetical protein